MKGNTARLKKHCPAESREVRPAESREVVWHRSGGKLFDLVWREGYLPLKEPKKKGLRFLAIPLFA